jgi:hypothetical protein
MDIRSTETLEGRNCHRSRQWSRLRCFSRFEESWCIRSRNWR